MGTEAERLKAEQKELERQLKELEGAKSQEQSEVEKHEQNLEAAKKKLQELKSTTGPGRGYEALKEEIRRAIQGKHGEVVREIDDGWESHLRYLEKSQQDLLQEMKEAKQERKKLQDIKVRLRDQGVAEFQTYTPSAIGDSPPVPPSQIPPISYSGERQSGETQRQGSEALIATSSPHTVPPTPEADES